MAEEDLRQDSAEMSFWDHLEVLRGTLFRSLLAICVFSVAVFCFKKFVFDDVVLAPTRSDFWVYKLLNMDVKMELVNLDISAQFFVHLKVAFQLGFILSFPFVIWEIWKFIARALYQNEKRTIRGVFVAASFLLIYYSAALPVECIYHDDLIHRDVQQSGQDNQVVDRRHCCAVDPLVDCLRCCETEHLLHILYRHACCDPESVNVLTCCSSVD